jgi:hypothetical protein
MLRLITAKYRVVVTLLASLFFFVIVVKDIVEPIANEAGNLATS